MPEKDLVEQLRGKEIHLRLVSNDLLETGKDSVTVISAGDNERAIINNAVLEKKKHTEYGSQSMLGKLLDIAAGKAIKVSKDPSQVLIVEEKNGAMSPDDVRYFEWLSHTKGERPRIIMLPEIKHAGDLAKQSHHLLDKSEEAELQKASFWKRQWRRFRALPAPISKDAALAAIPRTFIPVFFIIFLAYVKRDEILLKRVTAYIGLTFVFSVGFALYCQTLLNWVTFCSEFTRDIFEPYIERIGKWVAGQDEYFETNPGSVLRKSLSKLFTRMLRCVISFLSFISARGDVLIAWPSIGIFTTYLARLVLGPMGQTASVLSLRGFLLVVANLLVGTIAGGPYTQVIAHLRAVGKISNKASLYLQIVETIKMELGRVADFGMQTLYNVIQVCIASVSWLLLFMVDRLYVKPNVQRLKHRSEVEWVGDLFRQLRARDDFKKMLAECAKENLGP